MSSVKSWPSLGGDKEPPSRQNTDDIVKMGYLKKLKTMKKKYFVLRGDSAEASARLEYYDSEKKFKSNHGPKRSITLKTCFNINRRSDTRQKWVIALYTKNDCFCLVLESEEDVEDWLKVLLTLQHGEDIPDGELPRPTFEHVWQVVVQKKELGHSKNILGPYHLCLTDRTLSLVKMGPDSEKADPIEFSLHSIRRCGELESFFYLELGQMAVTGAGNLWMQTEDNNIAQNMRATILSACKKYSQKDLAPKARNRSSSATEASKPITMNHPRWPPHSEELSRPVHNKNAGLGPTQESAASPAPTSNSETLCHSGVSGGVRDRCDSLPSRARTTSEGPHVAHPHRCLLAPHRCTCTRCTRPHSMYNRTVSYSPPVIDSSPVSPDRACSTDSAGSSLSMEGDGTDCGEGIWQMMDGENRLGHSLTPEEPVIVEENMEDCARWPCGEEDKINNLPVDKSLCLPIQTTMNNSNFRKHSPNQSSSGFKSSSPSQGSLPDMYSPCGSSPLETSGAYMPMSPGDKAAVGYTVRGGGCNSINHSRGSSLAEEGYVPMAPVLSDDGYVDMGLNSRAHRRIMPDHYRSGELSPASSCSITSGTPSTDIRFSEYTLEKVSTYITPSEDDITPSERPARAYSVGSRPALNKRTDALNQSECQQRVRAFSVGSRCPRVPPEHLTPPPRHPLSSSHSSVEPSEDLMELDFSRNNKTRTRFSKKPSSSERLSVPPSSVASSAASSYSTAEGSYMEMSPRASPKPSDNDLLDNSHICPSPPKATNKINFIGRSPPKSYMDMKPSFSSSPPVSSFSSLPLYNVPEGETGFIQTRANNRCDHTHTFHSSSSPPITLTSLLERSHSPSNDAYMEMHPTVETKAIVAKTTQPRVDSFPVSETLKPQNFPRTTPSPPIKPALISTANILKPKSSQDDYFDMNLKRKIVAVEDNNNTKMMVTRTAPVDTPGQRPPDGYVEMSWGNGKPARKSSLENLKNQEDYMNMSGGGKKDRRGSRKERNRYSSQPIAIQSSTAKEQDASTSPVFSYVGRKHSTGTPPKVPSFLPLGSLNSSSPSSSPYSSLGRNRNTKGGTASRRDSKDLNSSSGISTPTTGSSTPIFPISLNSPGSPMKPFNQVQEKDGYESSAKCLVDATSGTVRISYVDQSVNPQTRVSAIEIAEQNDYVNFNPKETKELNSHDDYAPMKALNCLEPSRKISAPPILNSGAKSRSVDRIVANFSSLAVSAPEINSVPNKVSNCNIAASSLDPTVSVVSGSDNGESDYVRPTPIDRASSEIRVSSASNQAQVSDLLSATTSCSTCSGEKEIHYASLDLVKSECGENSSGLRNQSSTSSASTPSPNITQNNSTPTFSYAEIDFTKNTH